VVSYSSKIFFLKEESKLKRQLIAAVFFIHTFKNNYEKRPRITKRA